MSNTQLSNGSNYNVTNMIFSEPIKTTITDSKPVISYSRINISTRNADGTAGELVLSTPDDLFSFGVHENLSMADKTSIVGYGMSLSLYSKEGATDDQKSFVKTLDNIVQRCKEHLVEKRKEIGKRDLEIRDLKKVKSYYLKRDDEGEAVSGATPSLHPKLIESKKQGKILTHFFDEDGNELNPLDLIGKYCHTRAAIKIESIFIGNEISLQIKLYECEVRLAGTGMRRLLSKPTPKPASNPVVKDLSESTADLPLGGDDEDSDSGSLADDDDGEEYKTPQAPPKVEAKVVPKAPVKRVVKKGGKAE